MITIPAQLEFKIHAAPKTFLQKASRVTIEATNLVTNEVTSVAADLEATVTEWHDAITTEGSQTVTLPVKIVFAPISDASNQEVYTEYNFRIVCEGPRILITQCDVKVPRNIAHTELGTFFDVVSQPKWATMRDEYLVYLGTTSIPLYDDDSVEFKGTATMASLVTNGLPTHQVA